VGVLVLFRARALQRVLQIGHLRAVADVTVLGAAFHLAVGLHVAAIAAVVAVLVLDDAHVPCGVVGRLLALFLGARRILPVAVALLQLVPHALLVAEMAQQAVVGVEVVVRRLARIRGLVVALRDRVG